MIDSSTFFLADVDLDGNDELFLDKMTHLLWLRIYGRDLVPVESGNYRMYGHVLDIYDVTGDGRPEFFVIMTTKEGFWVACHNWISRQGPSTPLYTLGPYLQNRPRHLAYPEGSVGLMDCFDANNDGKAELYLYVNPFYPDFEPRSIHAYDGSTDTELWKFEMGPHLRDCQLLENPGEEGRIIVSSFAPDNGAVWNGTSDRYSYVFCLKPDGTLCWPPKPVSGFHSRNDVVVADMDRDNRKEIIVTISFGPREKSKQQNEDMWSIALLDPSNGSIIHSTNLGTGAEQAFPVESHPRRPLEAWVVGMDYNIYILDNKLNIRKVIDDRLHNKIHAATDIDMDGEIEIICSGPGGQLLVRDTRGNLKAEERLTDIIKIGVAHVAEERYIVAQSSNVLRFFLLEHSHIPLIARLFPHLNMYTTGPIVMIIAGACIGIAGTIIIIFSRYKPIRRESRSIRNEELHHDLLTAMIAFGHGGASLKVLDRLRFQLKNWEEIQKTVSNDPDPLEGLTNTYKQSVIPDVRRIALLARKGGVSKKRLQSMLLHSEKTTGYLDALNTAGTSGTRDAAGKHVDSALSSLDCIDECLADIRKHLRAVFRAPIVQCVTDVVSRRTEEFEGIGAAPRLTVGGIFNGDAFISQITFEKVLDTLIENAIRAMENSPSPELEITVESEGAYFKVDVRDTGTGIPEENWNLIFERHVTTKTEGGFGLHYSLEEVAKYGGKIFVLDSGPGKGTTFRIVLRRS